MKRLGVYMLSLCLFFSVIVPVPIKADDSIITVDGYKYKILNDREVKLLEYFYSDDVDISNPYIPGEISCDGKKYKVTELYISAGGHLKKLTVPEGMKRIELNEFGGFSDLEELHLPSTLKDINAGFCYSMKNLKTITLPNESENYEVKDGVLFDKKNKELICYPAAFPERTDYMVPEGIVTVRKGSFTNAKTLENLTMSSTVKRVNGGVFENSNLISIDFGNVESISVSGSSCFDYCRKLETIKIGPKAVFNGSPFYENDSLKKIEVSRENPYHEVVDGVLFGQTNKGRTLICYPAALEKAEYTIPEDTQYLAYSSFSMCNNLRKVIIPKSISSISVAAFNYGNNGLSKDTVELCFYGDSLPVMASKTFCDLYTGSKLLFKNQDLVNEFNQGNYIYSLNGSKEVAVGTLPEVKTESISLNNNKIEKVLKSDEKATVHLIAQVNPFDSTDSVEFKSDNEPVATVNDFGVVTIKEPGSATIKVKSGTKETSCKLNVKGELTYIPSARVEDWNGNVSLVSVNVCYGYGTELLKQGVDYIAQFKKVDSKRALVTATGIGNYTGTVQKEVEIERYGYPETTTEQPRPTVPTTAKPKPVVPTKKKITYVSNPSNATYTGKSIKKGLSVKAGKAGLKLNRDYTISYTGNKNCGKAKMIISGKGNYNGTYVRYFKIKPKKARLKKLKSGKKKMVVYISKSAGNVSGYQIRYSKYKNFKKSKYKTTKKTAYTLKKLSRKKRYYVKVRAYKVIDGRKYYGSYSSCKKIKVK